MDVAKQTGIVMQGHAVIWHRKILPINGYVSGSQCETQSTMGATRRTLVIYYISWLVSIYFYP